MLLLLVDTRARATAKAKAERGEEDEDSKSEFNQKIYYAGVGLLWVSAALSGASCVQYARLIKLK